MIHPEYLLTSVALPVVARVVEASEQAPCLATSLKLQMPIVRELLGRKEIQAPTLSPESPAMGAKRRLRSRLRKRQPIQAGVRPLLRAPPDARYSHSSFAGCSADRGYEFSLTTDVCDGSWPVWRRAFRVDATVGESYTGTVLAQKQEE
jgi:hypothetical protein